MPDFGLKPALLDLDQIRHLDRYGTAVASEFKSTIKGRITASSYKLEANVFRCFAEPEPYGAGALRSRSLPEPEHPGAKASRSRNLPEPEPYGAGASRSRCHPE